MSNFHSPDKARKLSETSASVFFADYTIAYFEGRDVSFKQFYDYKESYPWQIDKGNLCLGSSLPSNYGKISLLDSISDFFGKQGHKLRPPPWYVGHAPKFSKAVGKLDKNLKARVLDAINKIQKNPLKMIGDTQKPLSGELKGAWRHRIGDFRLIYIPVKEFGNILLADLDSRGSVY